MSPLLYIGLMSGTSMDGLDCALIDFSGSQFRVVDFNCEPLEPSLKSRLLALTSNANLDMRQLGSLDVEVAMQFAASVNAMLARHSLGSSAITAIGSHGQTVWHEPPQSATNFPFTLQIGDPNTLAELTGITVVADFRRRDMAAGGQGAPIVPVLHCEAFHSADTDRIVLNLGGIANITYVPRDRSQRPLGLDTGPANVLLDIWIKHQRNLDFDRDGAWARTGTVRQELLVRLLDEEYFRLPPPKSTGREFLNMAWLQSKLRGLDPAPAAADVQATLLALSADTISREILRLLPTGGEVIVCGGGAHNSALLTQLAVRLPDFRILPSSALGIDPDCVEALAFAWLAKKTLNRQEVDLSPFTGARHAVIAGGIYHAQGN